jgi:hypothetical protein
MWSRRPISGVPAGPQSRQAQLALTLWTCGLALALPISLGARGQALPLSNPRDLLATEPGAFARLLETARPTPVSAGEKARILSSLPDGRDHQPERPDTPQAGRSESRASSHRLGLCDQSDRRSASSHWLARTGGPPHLGDGAYPARCRRVTGHGCARDRARVRVAGI